MSELRRWIFDDLNLNAPMYPNLTRWFVYFVRDYYRLFVIYLRNMESKTAKALPKLLVIMYNIIIFLELSKSIILISMKLVIVESDGSLHCLLSECRGFESVRWHTPSRQFF